MLFDIAVLAICFPAFGLPLPPLVALTLTYIMAVLAYRALYLVVPAALGLPALASLRRRLAKPESRLIFCIPESDVG